MSILREQRPIAKRCIAAGLYQKLVTKLGCRFTIKQNSIAHLNHQFPKGEFLHVIHQARNVFVFVARTDNEGRRQALTERDVDDLLSFQQALLPADLLQHAYRLAPFLIIAANDKNQYAHLNKQGFCFMNKMAVNHIVSLIKNKALAKASPAIQCRLQSIFSPETFIPPALSTNAMPFLDQTQDTVLKQSLCSASYSRHSLSKAHLYQGTTGSGKTLVLLQRAKLLQQLHPRWNILVIAPNIATLHALQTMQAILDPDAPTEIICFQQWCRRHIKGVLQFIDPAEALALAERAVRRYFDDQRLTAMQLIHELIYSADRALDTLALYLETKRNHHSQHQDASTVFEQTLHVRTWEAMQDVAQALRQQNLHMTCDLAPLLWYQVLAGQAILPHYDAILVDDAHALAPIGFRLLYQARKEKTGYVFMMANHIPSQTEHYNASTNTDTDTSTDTWIEANIRVTEHDTMLNQCYRNSAEILNLANRLLQVENQAAIARRKKSIKRWRWPDKAPVLFHVATEEEEFDLLLKEITVLLDRGMHAKDILIIYAGNQSVRKMAMLLRQQLGLTFAVFGDPQQSEHTIYITTLDTIAAVESPVVFITGLQHLFAMPTSVPTTLEMIIHKRLKKLYRGMMCTQHQLTLMLAADHIPAVLQLKGLKVVKNPMRKNNVYPMFPVT